MEYEIYQNKQKNSTAYMKYYARPVKGETRDINYLATIIQRNCSMKHSDVLAVLKELQEVMGDVLIAGDTVKLDGIGNFKVGIHSEGVNLPSDFKPSEHIKSMHINFQQTWTRKAGGPVVKQFTSNNMMTVRKAR